MRLVFVNAGDGQSGWQREAEVALGLGESCGLWGGSGPGVLHLWAASGPD